MANASSSSAEFKRLSGKMAVYYNSGNPNDPIAPLNYLRGIGWMIDRQTGGLRSPFGVKNQQELDSLSFLAQCFDYSYLGTQ